MLIFTDSHSYHGKAKLRQLNSHQVKPVSALPDDWQRLAFIRGGKFAAGFLHPVF